MSLLVELARQCHGLCVKAKARVWSPVARFPGEQYQFSEKTPRFGRLHDFCPLLPLDHRPVTCRICGEERGADHFRSGERPQSRVV